MRGGDGGVCRREREGSKVVPGVVRVEVQEWGPREAPAPVRGKQGGVRGFEDLGARVVAAGGAGARQGTARRFPGVCGFRC